MSLSRPLVVFDLETTGLDTKTARIIEIGAMKIFPDGSIEEKVRRINPGIPVPGKVTEITGISTEDLVDEYSFGQVARGLRDWLGDADFGGYNSDKYDIPILLREMKDAGFPIDMSNRRQIDVKKLYFKLRPRTLSDAYRDYTGTELENAHGAMADVRATYAILKAMSEKHEELPDTVEEIEAFCRDENALDRDGKIVWDNGEAVIGFGKHQGKTLRAMVASEGGYLNWMLRGDFPDDTKKIIDDALGGRYPRRTS